MHINYSSFMHKNQGWGMAVTILIFWMNLRAMAPTITAGDSAELSTAQSTLGIAHSPGYPLFVLTGKVFSTLITFGNPAYRTNLFSAFCAGLSAWLCFNLLLFWTASVFLSFSASVFILFVPVIREQFISTEVFALNFLLLVTLLLLVSRTLANMEEESGLSARTIYLLYFLLGFGLGNQHTLVLLLPSLIFISLFVLVRIHKTKQDFVTFFLNSVFFFWLGLSIYLFLPIRSFKQPLLNWEDPQTWQRFWGVVTRARYGMFQLAQGGGAEFSLIRFYQKFQFLVKELLLQLSPLIVAIIFVGLLLALWQKKTRIIVFALLPFIILAGPFFLMLSNVSTGPIGYEIVSRFLPMPFFALFNLGIIGYSQKRLRLLVGAILLVSLFWMRSVQSLRHHFLIYDYGRNVLKTLPEKCLLFADRADEVEFSLAYLLYSEARRQDVHFVDCNAGVTRSIYGDDYYRIWGKPRLAVRGQVEKRLVQEAEHPVFYATVEPEMISIPRVPAGILFKAKPLAESSVPWDKIYSLRYDSLNPGFRGIPLFCSYAQLMGKYFLKLGEFEKSEKFFRILALSEPSGIWNHTIALWYFDKANYSLAERFFLKAIENDPEPDKVLCNLGILYEKQGKLKEAKACYERAVQTNPKSYQGHYNLGVLYWRQNLWKDVVGEFEAVLKINPAYSDAKHFLTVAQKRLGER